MREQILSNIDPNSIEWPSYIVSIAIGPNHREKDGTYVAELLLATGEMKMSKHTSPGKAFKSVIKALEDVKAFEVKEKSKPDEDESN